MTENEPTAAGRRRKRLAGAVGLLLVGGVSGGMLAATNAASAVTAPTSSTSPLAAPEVAGPSGPADSAAPMRAGEKALTGTNLSTAKAAAVKAVPGGTVFRVETDADGAAYEAHMSKADGTRVTVKFDKNFKVTAIQDGMGAGGPGGMGRGGPGGARGGTSAAPSGGTA